VGGLSPSVVVPVLIGVGVLLAVVMLAIRMGKTPNEEAELRLDQMTSGKAPSSQVVGSSDSLLKVMPIDPDRPTVWTTLLPKFEDIRKLYEQADVNLPFDKFMFVVVGLAVAGGLVAAATRVPYILIPLGALAMGLAPFFWLMKRKKRRVQEFVAAMPEAVELMSRALRAGHGLASGMNLVAEEMKGPVAQEFGRVFYEQNLGVPIEASLRGMAERVPSMDVRFFVTAVIIQRGTGGDLAEVLEKIGKLIRQRYELFGHVRALTAEGRLSGIVLLALPPALLGFLTASNYAYVEPLFTTPGGTKMLAVTAALQVVGALSIKKIVAIKV
jgi:tight adherence protein B